jgi:DNA invertase Pin-like site-specific DNA recombinase
VQSFKARGVVVHFHKENLVFSTDDDNPLNELLFNVMAAFAQFERALIRERQREGVQIAKARACIKAVRNR